MLELRPNCELCDKDLPPRSEQANICSYECTYCTKCVQEVLLNVCPTCGGGFTPRPLRPQKSWRADKKLGLKYDPASAERVHSRYTMDEIIAHVARIKDLPPAAR
jgi:hypothetical protein